MVNQSPSHAVNTTPTQNCAFSGAVSHISLWSSKRASRGSRYKVGCWIFMDIILIFTCFYIHTVPRMWMQKTLNIKIGWPILSQTRTIGTTVIDSSVLVHHSSIGGCCAILFMLIRSTGSNQDHSNANPNAWWWFQSNIPLYILGTRYIRLKLNDRSKWTHFYAAYMCLMLRHYALRQREHQLLPPPSPSYPVAQVCLCYGAWTFFLLCLLWASDLCIKAWLRMKQWWWRSHPPWQCFSLSLEKKKQQGRGRENGFSLF